MITDESVMPYGKYKGKQMADVPAEYLQWLFDNGKCSPDVKRYIENNIDVLESQIIRNKIKRESCKL